MAWRLRLAKIREVDNSLGSIKTENVRPYRRQTKDQAAAGDLRTSALRISGAVKKAARG